MLTAARALVLHELPDFGHHPDEIVAEFRKRYYETQLFWDPFAGGKFGNYLFTAHERAGQESTEEAARYLIDEAQLFIDAAHSCSNKLGTPVAV
jgi:sulfite reductase (ferredoxin)